MEEGGNVTLGTLAPLIVLAVKSAPKLDPRVKNAFLSREKVI